MFVLHRRGATNLQNIPSLKQWLLLAHCPSQQHGLPAWSWTIPCQKEIVLSHLYVCVKMSLSQVKSLRKLLIPLKGEKNFSWHPVFLGLYPIVNLEPIWSNLLLTASVLCRTFHIQDMNTEQCESLALQHKYLCWLSFQNTKLAKLALFCFLGKLLVHWIHRHCFEHVDFATFWQRY